jgi:hypothetical protein
VEGVRILAHSDESSLTTRRVLVLASAAVIVAGPISSSFAADHEAVVIGCLQRAGHSRYVLKDYRSGTPFEIVADNSSPERTLSWQVGHELEVHGAFQAARGSAGRRLSARSVIVISSICSRSLDGTRR